MTIQVIEASSYISRTSILEAARPANPREYLTILKKIGKEVDDLFQLSEAHLRLMTAGGGTTRMVFLDPNSGEATIHNSPQANDAGRPSKVVIPNRKQLQESYRVALELHQKLRDVNEIASQMAIEFNDPEDADMSRAARKAAEQVEVIRSRIEMALRRAADFMNQVASKNAPSAMKHITKTLSRMLSRGIEYSSIEDGLYVYTDPNGGLVFLHLFAMSHVVDADGKHIPSLFVAVSCTTDADGINDGSTFHLNTMLDFQPPGKFPLGGAFTWNGSGSNKALAKRLGYLLDLDKVSNEFGRVPLKDLLSDRAVTKRDFSVENKVSSLEVSDDNLRFRFVRTVNTDDRAYGLAEIIYKELYNQILMGDRKSKIRLRMRVGKERGLYMVDFFFQRPTGIAITEGDLEVLRDRWDISDNAMRKIVETINKD